MVDLESLIFTGLNGRVAALDRDTGEFVWEWRSPRAKLSGGYVTLALDGDRLAVSANGYLYCLDARTGSQLWVNELKGYSLGVAAITSVRAASNPHALQVAVASAIASASGQ